MNTLDTYRVNGTKKGRNEITFGCELSCVLSHFPLPQKLTGSKTPGELTQELTGTGFRRAATVCALYL